MKQVFSVLLSPMAFAIGFLWPLIAQSLMAAQLTASYGSAILIGGVVAVGFGLLAHLRGSWIWIK